MNQWFEHLTEQISLVTDEDMARRTLAKLTLDAGFRSFAYASVKAGTHKVLTTFALEWQERYVQKSYIRIDPVMQGLRHRIDPFTWSAVSVKLTKERRQFFGEAAEFGIRSGLTIPINAGFGQTAILTLASDNVSYPETVEFNPILAAGAVGQLHALLESLDMQPRLHEDMNLKPDELTCLRWSAEGKSMKAIATIENTSYATVCFHLRNAKETLAATTLPQATAIATALRVI